MDDELKYLDLVREAQQGRKKSMDSLARLVEPRLFSYIYRLVLNYDLAQDLLQDTLLEMVESLWRLNKASRFWPWLFRTALGKVQHHFREKKYKRRAQMSILDRKESLERIARDQGDGLSELVRKELSDAIFAAMRKLNLKYRNVLVLRCFEQLSYAQIGELMECSEHHSRVLFFRAKHSLKGHLAWRGFHGSRLFLTSLGLFSLVTTRAKAATVATAEGVSSATMQVGFLAAFIGAMGTRIGIAITTGLGACSIYFTIENLFIITAILSAAILFLIMLCLFTFLTA